jgi:thiamine biosynthesis protein ThiC
VVWVIPGGADTVMELSTGRNIHNTRAQRPRMDLARPLSTEVVCD